MGKTYYKCECESDTIVKTDIDSGLYTFANRSTLTVATLEKTQDVTPAVTRSMGVQVKTRMDLMKIYQTGNTVKIRTMAANGSKNVCAIQATPKQATGNALTAPKVSPAPLIKAIFSANKQ